MAGRSIPDAKHKFKPNLPLEGIKAIEFAGLAPGPMVGMILADFGADVIRIDRQSAVATASPDVLARGKRSIAVDPKTGSGYDVVRKLVDRADVLIDPFRPGVMERLKLSPDVFLGESGSNRRLVYARIVGFPRSGPQKNMAGHDLNYLALSGVLSMFPGDGRPEFPLNLLADFAGGGLTCALGVLLALVERTRSGLGQVVNTDMVSGVRYLSTYPLVLSQLLYLHFGREEARPGRATGLLDGGAPFYNVYTCADGQWMSVACLEPQFFRTFLQHFLKALPSDFALSGWRPSEDDQHDTDTWPRMKEFFERGFKFHPRDYWTAVFQATDACAVPVLSRQEAASLASKTKTGGEPESIPSPHPALSRTPSTVSISLPGLDISHSPLLLLRQGAHTDEILAELGMSDEERVKLQRVGALGGLPGAKL